jgi:hypothetical protein
MYVHPVFSSILESLGFVLTGEEKLAREVPILYCTCSPQCYDAAYKRSEHERKRVEISKPAWMTHKEAKSIVSRVIHRQRVK